MDAYSFISSLINSLVWPIIIFIVLLVYRKPVSQVFLNLSKIKYNNLEMDFGQELTKLEKTIDQVVPSDSIPKDTNKVKQNDIQTVAEISPSAAITMSWAMVEEELSSTIRRLAISPEYPPYNSTLKNILLLKDNGLIDNPTFESINEIRTLRNKAVHPAKENITYLEAIKYHEIAIKLTLLLRSIHR